MGCAALLNTGGTMNDDQITESGYRCFRCQSGCVHMVCGPMMLTLAPDQFLVFADKVNEVRQRMLEENDFEQVPSHASHLVM